MRSVLSLPARANKEAVLLPTPRYGRGHDLDVILEVIGSADRLPPFKKILFFRSEPEKARDECLLRLRPAPRLPVPKEASCTRITAPTRREKKYSLPPVHDVRRQHPSQ